MPDSRCLLNKMAVTVGTGMDELMPHNPLMRPACLRAVVPVAGRVAYVGKNHLSD